MKEIKYILIILQLTLLLFWFFPIALVDASVDYLRYVVLIQYFLSIVIGISLLKKTHSYNIFLTSFGIFLVSLLFFDDIENGISYKYASKFIFYMLTPETIEKVLSLLFFSLFSFNIALLSSKKTKKDFLDNSKGKIIDELNNKRIQKYAFFIIILLFPLVIIKLKFDYKQILDYGYLVLFSNLEPAPLLLRIGWFLSLAIYPILLIYCDTKKNFYLCVLLFFLMNFFDFVKGSRGTFFKPLAFFIWFFYNMFQNKDISIKRLAQIAFLLIATSAVLLVNRGEEGVLENKSKIGLEFVKSQGVSYYVMAYYFDYKHKFVNSSNFYIISPVYDFVMRYIDDDFRERDIRKVSKTLSLDHKLSYAVMPKYYERGNGLGGVFLIEFFALAGWGGFLILCFLLARLILFIEYKMTFNRGLWIIISWFWVQNIVWLPRGSLLSFLPSLITSLIIYYIIKQIILIKEYYLK